MNQPSEQDPDFAISRQPEDPAQYIKLLVAEIDRLTSQVVAAQDRAIQAERAAALLDSAATGYRNERDAAQAEIKRLKGTAPWDAWRKAEAEVERLRAALDTAAVALHNQAFPSSSWGMEEARIDAARLAEKSARLAPEVK